MADPGDLRCQEFVELVTEYLEDALPPAERARFQAHLDYCDACIIYIEEIRLTIRALGHLSEDQIGPAARDRLLAEFRDWKRAPNFAPTS
ncbi:MAG: zf-HC2 domain-containing protein [Chloroflexia bacterium]|nr:zf-HC2 domain-containing protein [Chloroflexia bacterium]